MESRIQRFNPILLTAFFLFSAGCAEKAGGPCMKACEATKDREGRCDIESGPCEAQCSALENTYQADVCEEESTALFDCMAALNYDEISCETELEAAIEVACETEAETARVCAQAAVSDE